MLPDGWRSQQIGDLLTLEYGDGLPKRERIGQGYPVYGSSGVIGRHSEPLIEGPGIVVGRKGTVGAVVWAQEDFWPIDTTYYVRPTENVDLRWVYWMLLRSGLGRLDASTGVPGLNRYEAYTVTVSVPPLWEQRRIAEILDAADEAIRQSGRIIAKLREVKKGLLHDLLTRGLDAEGNLRDPEEDPEAFKDSPLGRIPRGWQTRTLQSCASAKITYGIVQAGPDVEGGIPYIRTGDISDGRLASSEGLLRTSEEIATSYKRSEVRAGEIVCAIRATVGQVVEVPPELDGANLTQGTARIAPRPGISNRFLLWMLRSARVQRQFDMAVKGTTFREITLGALRKLKIALPTKRKEQDRIACVLDAHDARIHAEEAALDKLRQVKRGLMDDLLTGRVRVGV